MHSAWWYWQVCSLRHIGWPWAADVTFLDERPVLFRYPPRSAPALLEDTLPLRYCAVRFASRIPTWRLPPAGGVASLITDGGEEVGIVRVEPCVHAGAPCLHDVIGVDWVRGPVGMANEFDLTEKLQRTMCGSIF